jgi:hypothetical protein
VILLIHTAVSWYKHSKKSEYFLSSNDNGKDQHFSKFNWKQKFFELCKVINNADKEYEGIQCYENGDMTNDRIGNVFIFHVCNVIKIFMEGAKNQRLPELYIKTVLMGELYSCTKNTLIEELLDKDQMKFLIQEADFVYTWFSYWENASILPICTTVFENSDIFKGSSFFTNDSTFHRHQQGKVKQLYQDRHSIETCINNSLKISNLTVIIC